jgi:SRSO17 transposase
MTVWEPGKQPLPAKPRRGIGRPPRLLQRSTDHQPVSVKQLAMSLPTTAFREITWREAGERKLRSRFAAVRVRPAHRDYEQAEPHQEEWLLIEWPREEKEPTKYWVSTLPPTTKLKALIKMAKHRWIIERDYEELKQELGLGHFEGRNWRGFHHHATLCIASYGFLVAERNRFSPSARAGHLWIRCPQASVGLPPARFAAFGLRGITLIRSLPSGSNLHGSCSSAFLSVLFVDPVPDNPRRLYRHQQCTRRGGNGSVQCAMSRPEVPLR